MLLSDVIRKAWWHTPETVIFTVLAYFATTFGLAGEAPDSVLVAMLAASVALFGLPHGALDTELAKECRLWSSWRGAAAFNTAYVATAAVVLAVWHAAPVASLAAFLLMSAWHFGGDWRFALPPLLRFATGASMLALPSLPDGDRVRAIFILLSGERAGVLADMAAAAAPVAVAVLLAVVAYGVARRDGQLAVEVAFVTALASTAPALIFFTVYFCTLHSPRHLREHLAAADPAKRPMLLLAVVAYTAAALAAGAAMYRYYCTAESVDGAVLQTVFIGLAALTVPHVTLVWAVSAASGSAAATDERHAKVQSPHRD